MTGVRLSKPLPTRSITRPEETRLSAFWTTVVGPESAELDTKYQPLRIPFVIAQLLKILPLPSGPSDYRNMGIWQGLKLLLFMIPMSLLDVYNFFRGSNTYVIKLITNSVGRRMVETANGYLCLAPQETESGDYIFMLCGGLSYYILRKVRGEEDDTYVLVGDCYVYGRGDGMDCESEEARSIWIV